LIAPRRLSIVRIIAGAFDYPWQHRSAFARSLAIPALAIIACTLAWSTVTRSGDILLSWMLYGVYSAICSWAAVICHRLVLLDPADAGAFAGPAGPRRLLTFLVAVICIAFAYLAVMLAGISVLAVVTGTTYIPAGQARPKPVDFQWAVWLAQFVALYVSARLALTLPAIATDRGFSFGQAWIHSRGNGWRLAIVVFGLPWFASNLAGFLSRDGATVVEIAALLILGIVLLAVEVVALSLSFYDLTEPAPEPPPTPPPA
jgi:hypothetical protein